MPTVPLHQRRTLCHSRRHNCCGILQRRHQRRRFLRLVLNAAMGRFHITSLKRIAAFVAQVGHESGQLRYVRELGNDAYLSKYDVGPLALRLAARPRPAAMVESIAVGD